MTSGGEDMPIGGWRGAFYGPATGPEVLTPVKSLMRLCRVRSLGEFNGHFTDGARTRRVRRPTRNNCSYQARVADRIFRSKEGQPTRLPFFFALPCRQLFPRTHPRDPVSMPRRPHPVAASGDTSSAPASVAIAPRPATPSEAAGGRHLPRRRLPLLRRRMFVTSPF